ncbi:hypothetical protein HSBAA_28160 [Vreelandella sulfidaeris]|uniref:Biotin carboxyl carrier protein of acetyl-CoA carboxylase n=1 Tax=Vreelandella sulfidaeris TaxID=115553 RepID=A0A455U5T0_9GAMM|nr:hypothetical protein HSBAA_28160 [Halomonas sulfidaeris]
MDIRKVKKLIELLEESNISEIEIQEGEESVRISRHPNGATWQPQPMPHYAQQPSYAPSAGAPVVSSSTEAEPQGASYRGEAVNSPMVGTFTAAQRQVPSRLWKSVIASSKATLYVSLKP